tara:strand:+ start:1399 stop:1599 length:201 start_codon:yes stop_codon:yes gene_type:complete
MNTQEKLSKIRERVSDEQIASELSHLLSGVFPSVRSVRRWRTGETKPQEIFARAIDSLYENWSKDD